jgi:hypothetical protein
MNAKRPQGAIPVGEWTLFRTGGLSPPSALSKTHPFLGRTRTLSHPTDTLPVRQIDATGCCPHCQKPILVSLQKPPNQGEQQRDPQPWDLERAQRFTMPFGKFKGSTLAAIAMTEADL